jgi:hypothetical protein
MKKSDTLATLKAASKGLLFRSETDALFEAFEWPGEKGKPQKGRVLELAGVAPTTPVKTRSRDAFFADATKEQDWHDEDEKGEVERFKRLVETLQEALADVKVFLLGKGPQKDVYIVGRGDSGWAGLKTRVVET